MNCEPQTTSKNTEYIGGMIACLVLPIIFDPTIKITWHHHLQCQSLPWTPYLMLALAILWHGYSHYKAAAEAAAEDDRKAKAGAEAAAEDDPKAKAEDTEDQAKAEKAANALMKAEAENPTSAAADATKEDERKTQAGANAPTKAAAKNQAASTTKRESTKRESKSIYASTRLPPILEEAETTDESNVDVNNHNITDILREAFYNEDSDKNPYGLIL